MKRPTRKGGNIHFFNIYCKLFLQTLVQEKCLNTFGCDYFSFGPKLFTRKNCKLLNSIATIKNTQGAVSGHFTCDSKLKENSSLAAVTQSEQSPLEFFSLIFFHFHTMEYITGILKLSVSDVIVCQKGSNGDRKLKLFGWDYHFTRSLWAKIYSIV